MAWKPWSSFQGFSCLNSGLRMCIRSSEHERRWARVTQSGSSFHFCWHFTQDWVLFPNLLKKPHIVQDRVSRFHTHLMKLRPGWYGRCIVSNLLSQVFFPSLKQNSVTLFWTKSDWWLFFYFSCRVSGINKSSSCNLRVPNHLIFCHRHAVRGFTCYRGSKIVFVMKFGEYFFVNDVQRIVIIAVCWFGFGLLSQVKLLLFRPVR